MAERRVAAFDGLRAVACLAVVGYHLELPGFGSGWLGLDVFFVLSGYLIVGLLLAERERSGRVAWGRFYLRRAARLYPPLLLLVAAGLPWAGALGDAGHGYLLTAGLALTYTTDLWLWASGGTGGAFGHTWTLAVEEQFYLLVPVLLAGVRSRRTVLAGCAVAGPLSLAAMAWWPGRIHDAPSGYFLPHARVWELLLGAALAAWAPAPDPLRRKALGWLGLGCWAVTLAVAALWRYPADGGILARESLGICLGTAALLVAAEAGPLGRLFGSAPLGWVGRRSYGAYLYHPVLLLGLDALPWSPDRWLRAAALLAVTLLVADLSYRSVERPVLRRVKAGTVSRAQTATAA